MLHQPFPKSLKKTLSLKSKTKKEALKKDDETSSKGRRFNSCFSFREITIEFERKGSSLKDVDSNELKAKIVRWAKAIVDYARQFSAKLMQIKCK